MCSAKAQIKPYLKLFFSNSILIKKIFNLKKIIKIGMVNIDPEGLNPRRVVLFYWYTVLRKSYVSLDDSIQWLS